AAIWAEVLRVEKVGRQDNFFELGGHSLLAVTVVERLRRAGLHTDVRALFTAGTIAELAATLGEESREIVVPPNLIPTDATEIRPEMLTLLSLDQPAIDRIVARVPGGAANVQDIYPLAPLQEGILFHHLMRAEGDTYLLPNLFAFPSREALERFTTTMQALVDRHDILRTAVMWQGLEEPVQVVQRQVTLPLEEVSFEEGERDDLAGGFKRRFDPRHNRIDVSQAPLLRGYVAEDVKEGRWLLLVLAHHLAIDHTTLEILVAEADLIEAGRSEELAPVAPYRSFVAQARLGVSAEEHEAFFGKMLGDVDEPTAPYGLLDVQGDGNAIIDWRQAVEPSLARGVRDEARRMGVSAASVMHLAWALVLARVSARRDVVFGTVLFGRMQGGASADRVVG
ncbi:MAG: condensation domain-containing protein, partial [Gemmatimonadales bacterium]